MNGGLKDLELATLIPSHTLRWANMAEIIHKYIYPYCIPLYKEFVIGMDIKPEYQFIHINFASVCFLLNAVRAIETGWVVLTRAVEWGCDFWFLPC